MTFEIHEGRAIFEGDIDLGPAAEVPRTAAELSARAREESNLAPPDGVQRGAVVKSSSDLWPGGRVQYAYADNFPDFMRARVEQAVAYIHSHVRGVTLVRSWDPTGQKSIIFINSDQCQSPVGYPGGFFQRYNYIELGSGCGWGAAMHEILHSLGFWHEQSRCDRDNYVEILEANILSDKRHNFNKECGAQLVDVYDEGSIMHYGPTYFGISGRTTIRSKRGLDYLMGQRTSLSPVDRRTINRLYPPPAPTNVSVSFPAGGPLVSWTAMPTAFRYGVYVSIVVTEYDDEGQPIVVYEGAGEGVGETTGTSIVDQSHSYTGMTRCSSDRLTKDYYYAVYASYPDNGVSPMVRVSAAVAACGAPPEEEPPPEEPPPPPGQCWDGAGFEFPC